MCCVPRNHSAQDSCADLTRVGDLQRALQALEHTARLAAKHINTFDSLCWGRTGAVRASGALGVNRGSGKEERCFGNGPALVGLLHETCRVLRRFGCKRVIALRLATRGTEPMQGLQLVASLTTQEAHCAYCEVVGMVERGGGELHGGQLVATVGDLFLIRRECTSHEVVGFSFRSTAISGKSGDDVQSKLLRRTHIAN